MARRERLAAAIEVARAEPPYLRAGDLLDALPALLDEVPAGTTPVVFHSAVIAYLETPDRERFHDLMTGLVADGRCVWVSNEGPRVLPRGRRHRPAAGAPVRCSCSASTAGRSRTPTATAAPWTGCPPTQL